MYQISKNKVKSVDKGNKCVIDFYRFTDRIDTKQIRFPTLIDLWMDKSIPISIDRLLRVNRHIITNIIDHWSCSVSVKKKKQQQQTKRQKQRQRQHQQQHEQTMKTTVVLNKNLSLKHKWSCQVGLPLCSSSETQGQINGARESLNGRKNIYGTKKSKERRRPFGTGLVRHFPQGVFSPFFTFLRATFFRPFRLSLVPTICPWVSKDALCLKDKKNYLPFMPVSSWANRPRAR